MMLPRPLHVWVIRPFIAAQSLLGSGRIATGALFSILIAAALTPLPGRAAASPAPTPALTLTLEQPLRFGTMVVADHGARTVHANGGVTNEAIFSVGAANSEPAQFVLAYDRGSEVNRPISVDLELTLANLPAVTQGEISGALSAFETDLPGIGQLQPGKPVRATIANCTTRICTLRFHVGARLAVTRTPTSAGGKNDGNLNIAPPLTASVLAVRG